MTQGELAALLGFTRPTSITMVEQGVAPVTPMDLIRLSHIFDRPSWFWTGAPSWPTSLSDWIALARGDRERASAHHELDQRLELSFPANDD
jgi:hypothetical protein